MHIEKSTFLKLIDKYLTGQATSSERSIIEEYYRRLSQLEESPLILSAEQEKALGEIMLANIQERISSKANKYSYIILNFPHFRHIAAVLVIGILVSLYFLGKKPQHLENTASTTTNDFAPGKNRALLRLADGREINLDNTLNGQITVISGVKILKTSDGQVVYESSKDKQLTSENVGTNTISTPRGGQYQVILPDGTKVWLNSLSSITYPTAFIEDERPVEISGEVYFEVAHSKRKPFIVTSVDQKVEVLGTHFNINAYQDENCVKTTLLEGRVKVYAAGEQSATLHANQQSLVSKRSLNVNEVNGLDAIAWKNGRFIFNNESLESVMRTISRWYDVDIEYQHGIPKKVIGGDISKFRNITEILDVLEATGGIKFKIKGRRIIVM